ncbi:hypothetical protein PG993_000758 [Apiospora rasikravindrae]|uniref:Uncharacterized protein n=1 Tax=Apiospora rasikravindrae TaxID=990691 RepID=A0ABR1U9G9_9PEZI
MQPAEPKKMATAAPARPEPTKDAGNENAEEAQQQSKLYRIVMTPINLISFVLGLWLVDLRYRCQREHDHAHPRPHPHQTSSSSYYYLPAWLWWPRRPADEPFYYHSKQRKLLRMEASEAFNMRNSVLFGLVLAAMFVLWATSWMIRSVVAWLVA